MLVDNTKLLVDGTKVHIIISTRKRVSSYFCFIN